MNCRIVPNRSQKMILDYFWKKLIETIKNLKNRMQIRSNECTKIDTLNKTFAQSCYNKVHRMLEEITVRIEDNILCVLENKDNNL